MKLYYSLTFLYCFSWLQGIPSLTIWKTDIMLPLRRLVVKACRASRKGWKIPFVFETFDLWCELTFYECNKCFWRVVLHGAFLLVFVTVFFFHTCQGSRSRRWLFVLIQSLLMTTSKVCVLSFNFQIQQYEKEIRELKSQLDNCTYEVKYFILM